MAITESRLKDGTLSFGTAPGTDFACQVTNCKIETAYSDDGEGLETLCGDMIAPGEKLDSRKITGTVVQDWTATAGFTEFCYDNELEVVDFSYQPNATGPTISGQCRVKVPAETYGGDVNTRVTSDFEFNITGGWTVTP